MLIEAYSKFSQQVSKPLDNTICQQSLLKMESQQPRPWADRYCTATGKAKVNIHIPALCSFWLEKRRQSMDNPGRAASTQIK